MTPSERRTFAAEVRRAHVARTQAEDACCEIEELLWEIRHPRAWRRLAQLDIPRDPVPPAPH